METRQRLRVLVVGGQQILTEVLALLRAEQHQVSMASDGPGAIEAAQVAWPDVILIDLDARGVDGLSLVESIRSLPAWMSPMVIALTARPRERSARALREAGTDLYLARPLARERLRHFLQRFESILAFDGAI